MSAEARDLTTVFLVFLAMTCLTGVYKRKYVVEETTVISAKKNIAVAVDGQLEFIRESDNVTTTLPQRFAQLTALSFDPVQNKIYLSDRNETSNAITIFSLDLRGSNELIPIIQMQGKYSIQGIAYDSISKTMYWTDGHTVSIFNSSAENSFGKVLHSFEGKEEPWGIAVDSCNRYLYWTNRNHMNASIERSRLDGSNREVLIRDGLFQPVGIVVDQETQKLYWCDDHEGIYYHIESSNLDGSSRNTLVRGRHIQPVSIAVGSHSIYWMDSVYKAIWSIPKKGKKDREPQIIHPYRDMSPNQLVVWLDGLSFDESYCYVRSKYSESSEDYHNDEVTVIASGSYKKYDGSKDADDHFCLNEGVLAYDNDMKYCRCQRGYTGVRCDVEACHNYCVRGTCHVDATGNPFCHCLSGYRGERCERDVCEGFCLHGMECSVLAEGEPSCHCERGYKGRHCEDRIDVEQLCQLYCQYGSLFMPVEEGFAPVCLCSQYEKLDSNERSHNITANRMKLTALSCDENNQVIFWLLITSSVLCAVFFIITVFLIRKVYHLRKRPRIKKRIIVNKNVTPLTSRPPQASEQCEITIEDCCNMNVCETPCFEPQLRTSKTESKNEEKKTLLGDMEEAAVSVPCQKDLY